MYATPASGSGKEALRCSSGTSINDGLWHHIAVTYDGAIWRAYVDGIEDCTGTGVTGTLKNSAVITRIGDYPAGGDTHFSGLIDEVKIFDQVLSATEILNNINIPASPSGIGIQQ